MQADAKAKEGDLAVVYRNEVNNVTADSRFQYVTFPETITLPTAVTTDSFCMLRAVDSSTMFDGQVMLNANSFEFNGYTNTGMIRVGYSSADGINYTRTRFEGDNGELTNPVDLGTEVLIYDVNSFTANMGYFMQIDGSTFEGLYEYDKNNLDKTKLNLVNASSVAVNYNEGSPIYNWDGSYNSLIIDRIKLEKILEKIKSDLRIYTVQICIKDNKLYFYSLDRDYIYITALYYNTNNEYIGLTVRGSSTIVGQDCPNLMVYSIDLDTISYSLVEQIAPKYLRYTTTDYFVYFDWKPDTFPKSLHFYNMNNIDYNNYTLNVQIYYEGTSDRVGYKTLQDIKPEIFKLNPKYILAPTQFNLTASNELLPGKIAYGKNGVVTGDGTIYDNLSKEYVLTNILGIPKKTSGAYYLINKNYFIASSEELEIPVNKVQFIKQSDFTDRNKIYLMSKHNCVSTENDSYIRRNKYLSKSGEFYAEYIKSDTTLYDIVRMNDKSVVSSITITELLDYVNGKLIYVKTPQSATVSQKLYAYDIDTQVETELGDTPVIPSTYDWKYSYSYCHVYGNTVLYNVNSRYGSGDNQRIAASVRLYDLLTNTSTDLPTINVATTYSFGYNIVPILNLDGSKLSIFQRSRKSGTDVAVYYMYIYDTTTHTLDTKATESTTTLSWSPSGFLYTQEAIVIDNKAFGKDGYGWHVMDISTPTAIEDITLDGDEPLDYHHRNIDYATVNKQTMFITDKQYDASTKTLKLTYGDAFVFGFNCPVVIASDDTRLEMTNGNLTDIKYNDTYYTVTITNGNIVGKDIDVYAYDLSDNTDFNYTIVNSNTTVNHTLSVLDNNDIQISSYDGTITPQEYDQALETSKEIKGIN